MKLRHSLLILALFLSGCAEFTYYTQAVTGHLGILLNSRTLDQVMDDPSTPPETRTRLELARDIRDYASRTLKLPENRSYRIYSDLGRPAALWNVFAAPELSLELKTWCYPIAGCLGYRGYFSRKSADALAADLKAQGYETFVGPVGAYSTVGWFNDPLLNTVIKRSDPELAAVIFHELAHQRLFLPGDTAFSESFATAVEIEGVRRWLADRGKPEEFTNYMERLKRREQFMELVLRYRKQLETLYASTKSDDAKRAEKTRVFEKLRSDYAALKASWGGYSGFDMWLTNGELNNARMGAVGVYHQHVPAFQALFTKLGGDFEAFYRETERIAKLTPSKRAKFLIGLTEKGA
ncbi:MAG: aminopeptidase [Gammaproteobacteria bacterium]|nr:MAG: aminopeptidase [Gammaproteobacteria bacterium]